MCVCTPVFSIKQRINRGLNHQVVRLLRNPPHFFRLCSFSLEHSCSITEMMTAASSVSRNRMNIAATENMSLIFTNLTIPG